LDTNLGCLAKQKRTNEPNVTSQYCLTGESLDICQPNQWIKGFVRKNNVNVE